MNSKKNFFAKFLKRIIFRIVIPKNIQSTVAEVGWKKYCSSESVIKNVFEDAAIVLL